MNCPERTPHVVADVDTGIDDALALIYLAHLHRQGEIELTVTTSAGNCTAQDAAANSAEVLRCCGVSLPTPIVPGAASPRELELTTTPETHGPNGLGYWEAHRSARVEALNGPRTQDPRWSGWDGTARLAVEQWKQAEPDYLLVAGPATNIAYAVEHAPEVLSGCTVVFMAGAFDYPGNTTETAEWNVWVDPHALRYALENWPRDAKAPLMCPLNQTEKVLLYPDRLARWQHALEQNVKEREASPQRRELTQLMGDALRFYFEFHESVGVGYCAQIHDLAAAQVMLGNVGFNSREASIAVDVAGQRRGTTYVTGDGSAVRIVDELNSAEVFEEFERAVLESTKS
ncbi:nucleoside hydrolase [Corynebacterium resistens]|uniref:nucleoside hydrolase n=1 Tax=Corynebacterium resistens TaxID=258224 RepID=UPI002357D9FD|nr:nucleoside hydrolase [Corynebacterium resistens]